VVLLTRREADVTGGRHQSEAGPPKIAPRGGRLQIGTVADFKSEWWTGFKSEWWPTSNRNRWPLCVGICTTGRLGFWRKKWFEIVDCVSFQDARFDANVKGCVGKALKNTKIAAERFRS